MDSLEWGRLSIRWRCASAVMRAICVVPIEQCSISSVDQLAFHGGLNATLYHPPERMWAEMERVIPAMKENGGYMIGTDHSVPDSVSLDQFRHLLSRAKELGRYD